MREILRAWVEVYPAPLSSVLDSRNTPTPRMFARVNLLLYIGQVANLCCKIGSAKEVDNMISHAHLQKV